MGISPGLRSVLVITVAHAIAAAEAFVLTSPAVADGGALPRTFTGDGEAATPPLAWRGAPAGTSDYALAMHHLDPEGCTKWYWVLYGIPSGTNALPPGVQGVGMVGSNSITRQAGYAPPHSKGPGTKTYIITLYALSAEVHPAPPAGRPELLAAMEGKILASAGLTVTYTRNGGPEAARPP